MAASCATQPRGTNVPRPLRFLFPLLFILALSGLSLFSAGSGRVYSAEKKRVPRKKVLPIAILSRDDRGRPFSFPSSVYYDFSRDEFYVIESTRSQIVLFTPDFFPFFSFGTGRGSLVPTGLALAEDGTLLVAQGTGARNPERAMVSLFNAADIKIGDIYFHGFEGADKFYPKAIALGPSGHLYLAGLEFEGAVVLSRKGEFIKLLTPKDTFLPNEPAKKAIITDVYVDTNGHIYLLSEEMGRFYVYDRNERFLFKGGTKGGSSGKLSRPRGIAADAKRGIIYVIDYLRHTGLGYRYGDGKFLFEFGGRGWSPGWFNFPTDIAVDAAGRIYVADLFNHRVQVLELSGEEKSFLEEKNLTLPSPKKSPPSKD